jgi:uncharacterized protein (DUF433 family)
LVAWGGICGVVQTSGIRGVVVLCWCAAVFSKRNSLMATTIDIGTLITQSPEICGGRPRVAGTGISVMRIAGWHRLGYNPEEIALTMNLTLAQVHAALAYYHANREAIDSDLDNEASEYDRLADEHRSQHSIKG